MTESSNPHHLLDSVTFQVAKVLLENPKIQYSKSSLAQQAGISRDALYRRLDTYLETGLLTEADVQSENTYYMLDSSSEISDLLGRIMYDVLEVEE